MMSQAESLMSSDKPSDQLKGQQLMQKAQRMFEMISKMMEQRSQMMSKAIQAIK
jgi:flagellar basal body rod protein FlgG